MLLERFMFLDVLHQVYNFVSYYFGESGDWNGRGLLGCRFKKIRLNVDAFYERTCAFIYS